MSDTDLRKEIQERQAEPLLPIEKKLILGSLLAGVVLLARVAGAQFLPGRMKDFCQSIEAPQPP